MFMYYWPPDGTNEAIWVNENSVLTMTKISVVEEAISLPYPRSSEFYRRITISLLKT